MDVTHIRARFNSMPSQHTCMVSQASVLVHPRCVVKSRHNLDRKWLQAQSVKGTACQEVCKLIDSELIGKKPQEM